MKNITTQIKTHLSRYPIAASALSFLLLATGNITNAQNPLSPAQNFNLFTSGNFSLTGGDFDGAMAIGGNLIVLAQSASLTTNNATGGQAYVTIGGVEYSLVVGGGLTGTNGAYTLQINGKAGSTVDHYVRFNSLSVSSAVANGGGIDIGNPPTNNSTKYLRINATAQTPASVVNTTALVNFSNAFSTLSARSAAIAVNSNNVTPVVSGGQATLTLGNNANNVWNVTGATLNSYGQINLAGTLPNASNPLIINVNITGTFNWNNLKFVMGSESDTYMQINRAPYILWNFYNNTSAINIMNSNLILGSLLAPNSDLTNKASGGITGQVIAKTFTNPFAGELHIAPFNANVIYSVLPVQEINITPVLNDNQVVVNWQTTGELNISYFEVERSYNNTAFETISTTYSSVADGGDGTYHITDNSLENTGNVIFYRIKMVDKDGKVTYSKTAIVRINRQDKITVWPNPFINTVSFTYTTTHPANLVVRLLDISGVQIKQQQYNVGIGTSNLSITNLQNLTMGTYILEITDAAGNQKIVRKLMK